MITVDVECRSDYDKERTRRAHCRLGSSFESVRGSCDDSLANSPSVVIIQPSGSRCVRAHANGGWEVTLLPAPGCDLKGGDRRGVPPTLANAGPGLVGNDSKPGLIDVVDPACKPRC
jgi:hypothetical protein